MTENNNKWRKITIGDLGKIVTGKTPSTKNENFWNGDIPFVTPSDLQKSKHVFFTERTVSQEGLTAVRGQVLSSGAICVSCIGNLGYTAMTTQTSVSNQQINSIIPGADFDKNFVYYLMKSLWDEFKNLEGQSTTLSILNKTLFSKMEVIVPDLSTQQKIAEVLSSLDDKIELNTQINHNLEEQAKAIFKSWFVDFEPFGYKAPCTWESGILGDFVEIKRGGSPRPIQNYLSNSGLRWLKISDATACPSPFLIDIKEHIKESGLSKTVLLNTGALVLSNSATPGIPKILDVDSCIHDGWLYFPKSKLSNEFLFLFFKHIRSNLVSLGNGSIFTNLKTDILKAYPFILPDEQTLKAFNDLIFPVFERIKNNSREINSLAQLRDALLPKLMSGEIDISEVQV